MTQNLRLVMQQQQTHTHSHKHSHTHTHIHTGKNAKKIFGKIFVGEKILSPAVLTGQLDQLEWVERGREEEECVRVSVPCTYVYFMQYPVEYLNCVHNFRGNEFDNGIIRKR